MNLKVTLTFTATEDDWDISSLLENCSGINTEEAREIILNALKTDAQYVVNNCTISIKEDMTSL